MVIYYSCSGSSKRIAEIIAQKIDDEIECVNADVKIGSSREFYSSRPYVIVCPIFNMRIPALFDKFLRSSSFGGSDDVVFVAVCSYSSGNARAFVKDIFKSKERSQKFDANGKLSNKVGKSVYYNVVIMPSTNVFSRFPMSDVQENKVVARAEEQALIISRSILKGEYLPSSVSLVGVIGSAMNPAIVKTLTDKRLSVSDQCTACGICVDACSLDDIEIVERKATFRHEKCNHCSACVNLCPQKAIKVGKSE